MELAAGLRAALHVFERRIGDQGNRFKDRAVAIRIIQVNQPVAVVIDRIFTNFLPDFQWEFG